MPKSKTLVIGVSEKENRYSNQAVRLLSSYEYEVIALGQRKGEIILKDDKSIAIEDKHEDFENIDTITLYINPQNQAPMEDYIISLRPRRVIFNPGTENWPFAKRLEVEGIKTLEACTLVMLRTGQYN